MIAAADLGEQPVVTPQLSGDWNIQLIRLPLRFDAHRIAVSSERLSCTESACRLASGKEVLTGLASQANGYAMSSESLSSWVDAASTSPSNNIIAALHYPKNEGDITLLIGMPR